MEEVYDDNKMGDVEDSILGCPVPYSRQAEKEKKSYNTCIHTKRQTFKKLNHKKQNFKKANSRKAKFQKGKLIKGEHIYW